MVPPLGVYLSLALSVYVSASLFEIMMLSCAMFAPSRNGAEEIAWNDGSGGQQETPVTVAILAQGTSWADALAQAVLW